MVEITLKNGKTKWSYREDCDDAVAGTYSTSLGAIAESIDEFWGDIASLKFEKE